MGAELMGRGEPGSLSTRVLLGYHLAFITQASHALLLPGGRLLLADSWLTEDGGGEVQGYVCVLVTASLLVSHH